MFRQWRWGAGTQEGVGRSLSFSNCWSHRIYLLERSGHNLTTISIDHLDISQLLFHQSTQHLSSLSDPGTA